MGHVCVVHGGGGLEWVFCNREHKRKQLYFSEYEGKSNENLKNAKKNTFETLLCAPVGTVNL